ncbi:MAG: hypothetical protein EOP33_01465 [Rickettsiaceae bacterium]|nr:MAG: hypothetical protein EOP33_01465 [Rickettsiaceae bacterium]
MSAQLLELLFFAGIAFFIVNKFISILGYNNREDIDKSKSYFGEKNNLKDITGVVTDVSNASFEQNQLGKQNTSQYENLIVSDNSLKVLANISELQTRMASFNPHSFLRSAKSAAIMIIEAVNNNKNDLSLLLDKRFAAQFETISSSYGLIKDKDGLEAKISDLYMFGNNVFIKVLFTGRNFTTQIDDFDEEWTFSKSLIQSGFDWYLNNISKL